VLDPLPTGRWPVVVVGAGPAGALAALGLARQGVPMLLVQLRRGRESATVQAELVLVAAGLAHRCLRQLPEVAIRIQTGSRIGAGCLLPAPNHGPHDTALAAYGDGRLYMAIGRHGYVGLVRLEDGALNVGPDGPPPAPLPGPGPGVAPALEQSCCL